MKRKKIMRSLSFVMAFVVALYASLTYIVGKGEVVSAGDGEALATAALTIVGDATGSSVDITGEGTYDVVVYHSEYDPDKGSWGGNIGTLELRIVGGAALSDSYEFSYETYIGDGLQSDVVYDGYIDGNDYVVGIRNGSWYFGWNSSATVKLTLTSKGTEPSTQEPTTEEPTTEEPTTEEPTTEEPTTQEPTTEEPTTEEPTTEEPTTEPAVLSDGEAVINAYLDGNKVGASEVKKITGAGTYEYTVTGLDGNVGYMRWEGKGIDLSGYEVTITAQIGSNVANKVVNDSNGTDIKLLLHIR